MRRRWLRLLRLVWVVALVAVLFASLLGQEVLAATSGPNSPSAAVDDSTVGTVTWSTVTNVTASDNARASAALATTGTISHYVKATGFGFAIPANSDINGITVEVEWYRMNGGAAQFGVNQSSVKIVRNGTITGNDQSTGAALPAGSGAEAYTTFGGSTNLWGTTWTSGLINASNFGVAVAVVSAGSNSTDAYIDHIRITINYTATTWASYNDPGRSVADDTFTGAENTVYMGASGFTAATTYRVIFWDGSGANVDQQDLTGAILNANATAQHLFVPADTSGNWHVAVYIAGSAPGSYSASDLNIVADDTSYTSSTSFNVDVSAIPEFPDVMAGIAVAGMCFGIYWKMRKRAKFKLQHAN